MDFASAPTATALRYRVGGMDCPSCAGKIETALGRLGGAGEVRVDHGAGTLALRLDEGTTSRNTVEDSLRAMGFEPSPLPLPGDESNSATVLDAVAGPGGEDGGTEREPFWRSARARPLLAIGALLVIGYGAGVLFPGLGGWAELPAALLGLWFTAPRAVALARFGSPFSIEMLMTVAVVGAVLIGAPAEAGAVVFLFMVGELMEGVAAGRARAGIQALAGLVPRTALLVEEGAVRSVPAEAVLPGQTVLVRPGDRVSVDGTVTEGESGLDESPVTGESVPVAKGPGATVLAGSVNGGGALHVRATRAAADNTIARIVRLVEEAQAARAPTARFIERFSRRYTPAVVAVAASTALLPPLLLGWDWGTWAYRAIALLLIGCPCALVLSTPAAITSGIAAGARRGLLVKGGAALEALARIRTVAFDKTGTLTAGRPVVTEIEAFSDSGAESGTAAERVVLGLAAAVEQGSSHPLAGAILAHAEAAGVPLRPAGDARAIPGHGVQARVAGRVVLVGSPRHVAGQVALPGAVTGRVAALEEEGKTVVLVVADGRPLGLLALRDEPRPDAAAAMDALRALGIRPLMLTGDHRRAGEAVGAALGLEVRSGLLPEDKLEQIAALKAEGPVAMVGDGINDAPALAAASVGIAMGGGTDVALETADAAVLGGRVSDVPALVRLSRATLRNIHQNVAVALGLKLVLLVTTLAGITGLWPAILADTGATVLVTANALRLLRHR